LTMINNGGLLTKEIETNERIIKVASSIDAAGLFCTMPIVHFKLELEYLNSNQVVEGLADDTGFAEDADNWHLEKNNAHLSIGKNEKGIFVAHAEKT
jgi:TusA-related sulfurtransferase